MNRSSPVLVESLQQLVALWRLLVRPFAAADVGDLPGIALSWANIPGPLYNILFLTEVLREPRVLQERLVAAAGYMRQRHPSGGFLVVCHDTIIGPARKKLAACLEAAGFVESASVTAMVWEGIPLQSAEQPDLTFKRIVTRDAIKDCVGLNSLSHGLPLEAGQCLLDDRTLWQNHAIGYVAYLGGRAVATATAVPSGDCLLLFLVATHPECRRLGYGSAVVRHALQRAHHVTGLRRTLIHTTPKGCPLFEAMGYQATERFTGYALKPAG
jgi:GNAT superfamily N-acetyltransferase